MEQFARNNLFLMEFNIDNITLTKYKNEDNIYVSFQFWDNAPNYINYRAFSSNNVPDADYGEDYLQNGKSCYFQMTADQIYRAVCEFEINVKVVKEINFTPTLTRKTLGGVILSVREKFDDLVKEVYSTNKKILVTTLKNTFSLLNDFGNVVGSISLCIHLSCMEKNIMTSLLENETLNDEDKSSFPPSVEDVETVIGDAVETCNNIWRLINTKHDLNPNSPSLERIVDLHKEHLDTINKLMELSQSLESESENERSIKKELQLTKSSKQLIRCLQGDCRSPCYKYNLKPANIYSRSSINTTSMSEWKNSARTCSSVGFKFPKSVHRMRSGSSMCALHEEEPTGRSKSQQSPRKSNSQCRKAEPFKLRSKEELINTIEALSSFEQNRHFPPIKCEQNQQEACPVDLQKQFASKACYASQQTRSSLEQNVPEKLEKSQTDYATKIRNQFENVSKASLLNKGTCSKNTKNSKTSLQKKPQRKSDMHLTCSAKRQPSPVKLPTVEEAKLGETCFDPNKKSCEKSVKWCSSTAPKVNNQNINVCRNTKEDLSNSKKSSGRLPTLPQDTENECTENVCKSKNKDKEKTSSQKRNLCERNSKRSPNSASNPNDENNQVCYSKTGDVNCAHNSPGKISTLPQNQCTHDVYESKNKSKEKSCSVSKCALQGTHTRETNDIRSSVKLKPSTCCGCTAACDAASFQSSSSTTGSSTTGSSNSNPPEIKEFDEISGTMNGHTFKIVVHRDKDGNKKCTCVPETPPQPEKPDVCFCQGDGNMVQTPEERARNFKLSIGSKTDGDGPQEPAVDIAINVEPRGILPEYENHGVQFEEEDAKNSGPPCHALLPEYRGRSGSKDGSGSGDYGGHGKHGHGKHGHGKGKHGKHGGGHGGDGDSDSDSEGGGGGKSRRHGKHGKGGGGGGSDGSSDDGSGGGRGHGRGGKGGHGKGGGRGGYGDDDDYSDDEGGGRGGRGRKGGRGGGRGGGGRGGRGGGKNGRGGGRNGKGGRDDDYGVGYGGGISIGGFGMTTSSNRSSTSRCCMSTASSCPVCVPMDPPTCMSMMSVCSKWGNSTCCVDNCYRYCMVSNSKCSNSSRKNVSFSNCCV